MACRKTDGKSLTFVISSHAATIEKGVIDFSEMIIGHNVREPGSCNKTDDANTHMPFIQYHFYSPAGTSLSVDNAFQTRICSNRNRYHRPWYSPSNQTTHELNFDYELTPDEKMYWNSGAVDCQTKDIIYNIDTHNTIKLSKLTQMILHHVFFTYMPFNTIDSIHIHCLFCRVKADTERYTWAYTQYNLSVHRPLPKYDASGNEIIYEDETLLGQKIKYIQGVTTDKLYKFDYIYDPDKKIRETETESEHLEIIKHGNKTNIIPKLFDPEYIRYLPRYQTPPPLIEDSASSAPIISELNHPDPRRRLREEERLRLTGMSPYPPAVATPTNNRGLNNRNSKRVRIGGKRKTQKSNKKRNPRKYTYKKGKKVKR